MALVEVLDDVGEVDVRVEDRVVPEEVAMASVKAPAELLGTCTKVVPVEIGIVGLVLEATFVEVESIITTAVLDSLKVAEVERALKVEDEEVMLETVEDELKMTDDEDEDVTTGHIACSSVLG